MKTDDILLLIRLKELYQATAIKDMTAVIYPIEASEWVGSRHAYPTRTYLWGAETTSAQIGHLSVPRSSSSF